MQQRPLPNFPPLPERYREEQTTFVPGIADLPVHPLAALFPMMSEDELVGLAEDIKANGLVHPITLGDWKDDDNRQVHGIIDGRNRLRACALAEVEPKFVKLNGHDPTAYIVSVNLARRNLTKGQQAMLYALAHPEPEKGGRGKKAPETGEFSRQRLGEARAVLRHSREAALAVVSGGTSLDEALNEMKERLKADAEPAARIAALQARYPDLAAQVIEDQLSLEAAEVEARVRDRKEAEQRETMLKLGAEAFYSACAFASKEFVAGLSHRLAEPEFRIQYLERLRVDREDIDEHIDQLRSGFANLLEIIGFLGEE